MSDKKEFSPDIKKPTSRLSKEIKIWGGILLVCVAVVGLTVLIKTSKPNVAELEQHRFMQNAGLPDGFFASPEMEEPEPAPSPLPIKIEEKPAPQPTPPKPKPITASDLFHAGQEPQVDPRLQKISMLNAKRRGAVAVMVADQSTPKGVEVEYINSQERWKESQTKASYPVNMERVVTVDRFIPAILVNEINSELGGKVVAVVEKNVYGAHGRKVLIPAGSKAIGMYKPLDKVGQERLSIHWPRIITPEGINIHTGNADMTDAMGRSGVTGDVDRRYVERYGMSFLVSMLTAATAYSVPVRDQNQQLVVESFGRETGSLSKAILDEHLDIKPRVTIPAGSRIMITASKDIWFKPPEKKQIAVQALEDL